MTDAPRPCRNNGLAGVPCMAHGGDCDGSTPDCGPRSITDVLVESWPGQCCSGYCIESIGLHNVDSATARVVAVSVAGMVTAAKAEAWDEGWDASVAAAEACDVAGGDWSCGECAICTTPNPYRAAAQEAGEVDRG